MIGRPYLYQCEWARCPHTEQRGEKERADIQPEDHWSPECDKSWSCNKHEFHHLHLDCADVLGVR